MTKTVAMKTTALYVKFVTNTAATFCSVKNYPLSDKNCIKSNADKVSIVC